MHGSWNNILEKISFDQRAKMLLEWVLLILWPTIYCTKASRSDHSTCNIMRANSIPVKDCKPLWMFIKKVQITQLQAQCSQCIHWTYTASAHCTYTVVDLTVCHQCTPVYTGSVRPVLHWAWVWVISWKMMNDGKIVLNVKVGSI